MKLQVIPVHMTVCKLHSLSQVQMDGETDDEYVFLGKTDNELSLVCQTTKTPNNTLEREDGWRMFRIEGQLEFSLIGILARISTLLAENQIGIFVISTFDTDYVLTKEENFDRALKILAENGYEIV